MFKLMKKFHQNIGGNFAITFGLALTPMLMGVGLAIDYSRMTNLQVKMEGSSDAALLAAMKKLDNERNKDGVGELSYEQTIEILEDEFEPFFEANLLSNSVAGYKDYEIDFIQIDNEAIGTVTVTYDPVIMNVFGHDSFDLTTSLKVNLKIIPDNFVFDIVMCIDATGSMQNTLDAAVANAQSFDNDLRDELGIAQDSDAAKIRIRPIFYRDYTEQDDWLAAYNAAVAAAAAEDEDEVETSTDAADMLAEYVADVGWYYKSRGRSPGWKQARRSKPATHKRVIYDGDTNGWTVDVGTDVHTETVWGTTYYYFPDSAAGRSDLETAASIWFADDGSGDGDDGGDDPVSGYDKATDDVVLTAGEVDDDGVLDDEITQPEALKAYADFIDMNPNLVDVPDGMTEGAFKVAQGLKLENFLASENAQYGADLPEAAGACLDEAMRSNWWVEDSQESRDFFDISADTSINDPDALKSVNVTTVPLIVTWTDAAIQNLNTTRNDIQPTQPGTYSAFENQWKDANIIPQQDKKILMLFGPETYSGWSTIKNWEGYVYGGPLSTGNSEAVDKIADEILKLVPEVLRISG